MEQQKIATLYCRLGNEDTPNRESDSIANQKASLTKYATERGFKNLHSLADDGYFGANFNRLEIQEAHSFHGDIHRQADVSTRKPRPQ